MVEVAPGATPPRTSQLLRFVAGAVVCVLLYLFLLNFQPVNRASPTQGLVPVLVLALSTGWLTARFLRTDRLAPSLLGVTWRERPMQRFALGFVTGCALVGCWAALLALINGMHWRPNPEFAVASLAVAATFNLLNNVGEELVYRGYLFVRLAERWGAAPTILLTSAIFALLHLQSGLPWQSVLASVFTSALIFGAIFARWGSLPLTLGFHVAINVAQDSLGLRLSDASIFTPQLVAQPVGSGTRVLIAIAIVNVLVAVGVLTVGRRRFASGTEPLAPPRSAIGR